MTPLRRRFHLTMLKDLAKKFTARAYLAYARHRDRNDVIDVGEYLSKIATALILPPEQPENFKTAMRILDGLRQHFAQTQFYLLTPKTCAEMVSLDERLRLISYDIDEIGFYGLPKDKLQHAIRSRHFDMVIDLNLDFSLIATFLCRASEAKLRICFVHPARDPFYNFQMRAIDSNSLEQKYQSLINYLAVFTNSLTPRETMTEAMSVL
jgi:hypothetical protein